MMMTGMAKRSDIGGYDPTRPLDTGAQGGGRLNPFTKEVGKRGIGRKIGNGLNSYAKPLVAQRAGGIFDYVWHYFVIFLNYFE